MSLPAQERKKCQALAMAQLRMTLAAAAEAVYYFDGKGCAMCEGRGRVVQNDDSVAAICRSCHGARQLPTLYEAEAVFAEVVTQAYHEYAHTLACSWFDLSDQSAQITICLVVPRPLWVAGLWTLVDPALKRAGFELAGWSKQGLTFTLNHLTPIQCYEIVRALEAVQPQIKPPIEWQVVPEVKINQLSDKDRAEK